MTMITKDNRPYPYITMTALLEHLQMLQDIRFAWVHEIPLKVRGTGTDDDPYKVSIATSPGGVYFKEGVPIDDFARWSMRIARNPRRLLAMMNCPVPVHVLARHDEDMATNDDDYDPAEQSLLTDAAANAKPSN